MKKKETPDPPKEKNPEMIQSVTITFSDGEKAIFTGRATVFPGQSKTVADMSFSIPKPMPPDCVWEKV